MTDSIRFYWNGIRLNGEKKMVKLYYSLDNNSKHEPSVSLSVADYSGDLPRDLFEVHNDTDIYTDYFDSDHAYLTPEHPLYKYARFAAEKAKIRELKSHIAYLEKAMERDPIRYCRDDFYRNEAADARARLAELESHKDPGQPTKEDLEAVQAMKLAAESARIAAQKKAEQKRQEKELVRRANGRRFILDTAGENPIREGEPVVTIEWSENPAFYGWKDGELKLSVAAAEIILKHFDEEVHAEEDRGYDKTKFTIAYVNEDGEQDTYEGRYDLGDNDGGMIEHIRSFGRFYAEKGNFGNGNVSDEDKEQGEAIMAFADMLEQYTAHKAEIIEFAPWFEKAVKARESAEKQDMTMVLSKVESMTFEQLEEALYFVDPDDRENEEVAKFFIQQMGLRDIMRAIQVAVNWQNRVK